MEQTLREQTADNSASNFTGGKELALKIRVCALIVESSIVFGKVVSYSTVVLNIGIMKVWGFWPKVITPKPA